MVPEPSSPDRAEREGKGLRERRRLEGRRFAVVGGWKMRGRWAFFVTTAAVAVSAVSSEGEAGKARSHQKGGRRRLESGTRSKVVVRGERASLELGVGLVGLTSVPYVCATIDWWPEEKCDWGVCDAWKGLTVTTLDLSAGSKERAELTAALKALAPAALRVGGSMQDLVTYDVERKAGKGSEFGSCGPFRRNAQDRIGFAGGCLSLQRFDELNEVALEAGAPLIFGLSGLHGRERQASLAGCDKCAAPPCEPCWTGVWRPKAGARRLLEHAFLRAANNKSALTALSLGNELCGAGGIVAHLAPEAVARDYAALDAELKRIWGADAERGRRLAFPPASDSKRPMLVGPDCQLPQSMIESWNTRFFLSGGDVVDAFTYHLYWLGAGSKSRYMVPKLLDRQSAPANANARGGSSSLSDDSGESRLVWPLDRAFFSRVVANDRVAAAAAPRAQVWASESGGFYGSGAPNVTDAFLSAFWYLDELAEMAAESVSVHCRQTLVGGNYALLRRRHGRDGFLPNPDFLATRLFARLAGPRVVRAGLLTVATKRRRRDGAAHGPRKVRDARAYAHCRLAPRGHPGFGDLVVLVINSASARALRVEPPAALRALERHEFHVTAPADIHGDPDIFGRVALLNGRPFDAVDAPLVPLNARPGKPLTVDPLAYTFFVFRDARWPTCLASSKDLLLVEDSAAGAATTASTTSAAAP